MGMRSVKGMYMATDMHCYWVQLRITSVQQYFTNSYYMQCIVFANFLHEVTNTLTRTSHSYI